MQKPLYIVIISDISHSLLLYKEVNLVKLLACLQPSHLTAICCSFLPCWTWLKYSHILRPLIAFAL